MFFPSHTKCFKKFSDAFSFVRAFNCEQAHAFTAAVRRGIFPTFLQRGVKISISDHFSAYVDQITGVNPMRNLRPQEYLK